VGAKRLTVDSATTQTDLVRALKKPTQKPSDAVTPEIAVARMNKALKKLLETPPETHEEMVRRRKTKAKTK
jgi:hypothetical protein